MKLRKLGKIIAIIVAVLLLALFAIPFFIPADYLKAQVIAQVKQATGRDLVINGKTSLELFPAIAVSVEDVTLSNPPGFTSQYFVHLDKLKTGAALAPLLHKQLSVTGITLEGMQLNLEQNQAGAKNWEFTVAKAKEETQTSIAQKEANPKASNPFSLGDVTVKNSAVTYLKASAKPMVAKNIELNVTGADGGNPLKVDGKLTFQNEAVEVHLSVEQLKALLSGKTTPVSLNASLPYASSVAFFGQAAMQGDVAANGQLTLHLADLPKLLAWATGKPAAAGLPQAVSLETKFLSTGPQAYTLEDMDLKVDALEAKGKLAANLAGAVPSVNGALQVATLDLAQFSKGSATGQSSAEPVAEPSPAKTEGWSDAPIDASGLRAANAELDLAIATLRSGKLTVSNIAAHTSLQNGVLKLALSNAALYNGTAKGTVTLDGSSAGVGLGTDLTFSNIQIEPLMTALAGNSRLAGSTNLSLAITSRGASERAIVSALGGNANLAIHDGAVKGINIAQFLRNAKKGFLFGDNSTEKTDFSALTASFTIAQGIVSNKDLSLQSPILRVTGSGTTSLPARTMNYRLVPSVVGTLQGQGGKADATGLAVPLIITGSWANPNVTPDVAGMIQQNLQNPDVLKQNLKDLKGQLKNLNSPKDLGRALFGGSKTQ